MAWTRSLRDVSSRNCVPLNPGQLNSRPVESGRQQLAPESSNSLGRGRGRQVSPSNHLHSHSTSSPDSLAVALSSG